MKMAKKLDDAIDDLMRDRTIWVVLEGIARYQDRQSEKRHKISIQGWNKFDDFPAEIRKKIEELRIWVGGIA